MSGKCRSTCPWMPRIDLVRNRLLRWQETPSSRQPFSRTTAMYPPDQPPQWDTSVLLYSPNKNRKRGRHSGCPLSYLSVSSVWSHSSCLTGALFTRMHLDANTNVDKDSAWRKQCARVKLLSKSVAGLGAGLWAPLLGSVGASCHVVSTCVGCKRPLSPHAAIFYRTHIITLNVSKSWCIVFG